MPWFWRRRETLNEKLLREAGYSRDGMPEEEHDPIVAASPEQPPRDTPDEPQGPPTSSTALPGLVPGSARSEAGPGSELPETDIVGSAYEPDLKDDSYTFTVLPDGSLIVDDSCDEDLSRLADAVEEHVKRPYRASAARDSDSEWWTLAARHLDLVRLKSDGDLLELTSVGGVQTYAIDGREADAARAPAELVALGKARSDDFHARAVRIDGDLWDVGVLLI